MFRRSLALAAAKSGAEVVAVGAGGDGFEPRLRAAGVNFHAAPISFRAVAPLSDLRLLAHLTRLFRRTKTDVCHAFTVKPAIFATLAAAMSGVPVRIVTVTGLGYSFTSAHRPLRWVVQAMYRMALRFAHRVYFQNASDRDLFVARRVVAESKSELIAGSGVDLERFQSVPLPSLEVRAPVFLLIARLLKDKGVVEFQAAASRVRAKYPAVRCILLGGEDRRNPSALDNDQTAALRASPDVELLGEVDDVRPIIAQADVVVLPSYREGLPRSLLEGGAMGRALIATDVPGCRDVVTHDVTGLIVRVADAASLADAMERLVNDPQLIRRLGAQARVDIAARFDENKVISNTLETYRRLMSIHARDRTPTHSA